MTAKEVVARAAEDGTLGRYFEVQLASMYADVLERGGIAIDGGANSGLHSIGMGHSLGRKAGHVFGFEPQPDVFVQAVRWVEIEEYAQRVSLVPKALGAEQGEVAFFKSSTHSAFSSLRKINLREEYSECTVQLTSIDAFLVASACGNNVKFIKLDLEGGEYHALLGARATIIRSRPVICFENAPAWAARVFEYPPDGIPTFLESLGYTVFDFFGEPMIPDAWCTTRSFMFFAVPTASPIKYEIMGLSERFWTTTAPTLDLSTWARTVAAVLEAARAGHARH